MRVVFLILIALFLGGCGQKEKSEPTPLTAPQQFIDAQKDDLLGPCLLECQRYCQAIGGSEYCTSSGKCQSDCQRKFAN